MDRLIETTKEAGKIKVISPYNSDFVTKARNLQGSFSNGAWYFPESIEEHVLNALKSCYGVTGETEYETCTLLVKDFKASVKTSGVELFGRPIAKAFGRDSGAKLQTGIILINGKVDSAGSVKNWYTEVENATFEIQEFPVDALEREDVKLAISEGWVEVKRNNRSKEEIQREIAEYKRKIQELESELASAV